MKTVFLESHNIKNTYIGFGQFNLHLLKALTAMQHDDYELTACIKRPSAWKNIFGPDLRFKKYHFFRRYPAFRIRKRYDLWHSLNQNISIEPFYQTKYLLTVHDVDFAIEKNTKKINRFKEKLKRASAITYISDYVRQETNAYFNIPDIKEYVIYNGNPVIEKLKPAAHFKPAITTGRPFLYSIGNFLERKNFHALVDMMTFLPEWDLIISGDNDKAYGERVKRLIEEKKLQQRIFLTGKVSEPQKQYYMQNCVSFVFPSLREGFGLPVIEAMKFEKPVFLSNRTSLPEIGCDAAYYWDDFSPEAMSTVFREGFRHFDRNKQLMQKKLQERADFFSWKKAAQQYDEVYRSLL